MNVLCRFKVNLTENVREISILLQLKVIEKKMEKHILKSYLSFIDGDPVCCGKPLMIFDVIHTIFQIAKSFGQVHLKQIPQEVFQIWAKVRRKSYLKN